MPVETRRTVMEFGIEATESLVWQVWEPGREYTKNIVLKNVNPKTKKLKFRIPNTKYFVTKYPQPIVLSSGTSVKLPVTFRPIEKDIYEDAIAFQTQDGQFYVPIKATIQESRITMPREVNFGMSAVKDQIEEVFEIVNLSNVSTPFYFDESKTPFGISPRSGTIPSKGRVPIKASFKPEAAQVYGFVAWCTFDRASADHRRQSIRFEGLGKFPYLRINIDGSSGNNLPLDFGRIGVAKEKSRTVEIINMTPVNAPFQILQTSQGTLLEQVFSCSQYHGTVGKNSSLTIKVSCKCSTPNMKYADEFQIRSVGSPGTSTVKCKALSLGPNVSFKTSYISFGVTEFGASVTKSFQLINSSDLTAVFEFENDNNFGAFQLDHITGEIKPNSSRTIVATFTPRVPINYYKKLVCLVHNHDPIFIRMFGTCQSEEQKPEVLQKVHLDRYEINAERGVTRLGPEILYNLTQTEKVVITEDGTLEAVDILVQDELHKEFEKPTPMEEYFDDEASTETPVRTPHVSPDARQIDFGRCGSNEIYQKTVNIANNTRGKVTCQWMTALENTEFSIAPSELDINPLSSASFQIFFQPLSTSQFFDARLEAYVYYKPMRDFRLVKDYAFFPPWCVNVAVFGHTFPERVEPFVPKCKWNCSTMVMPPVTQSAASYKSMLLTNTGNAPVHYDFETGLSSLFSCKPSMGLCRGQYKIILFRMLPSPPGLTKETMQKKVNVSEKYTEMLTLLGTCEEPAVELKPKDVLYFKPTCLGAESIREVTVKNITRKPLRFSWVISQSSSQYFRVKKKQGVIKPNETQTHYWSFLPMATERRFCKAAICVLDPDDSTKASTKFSVRLIGQGQIGSISVKSKNVKFGKVVVGTSQKREVKVINNSDCTLNYQLHAVQTSSGPYGDDDVVEDTNVLELDHDRFSLPAKAEKSLVLSVFPGRRVQYNIELLYELIGTDPDNEEPCLVKEAEQLCMVTVTGVYPSVYVSDVRGTGCLAVTSKARLWELFSLERLNMYLHDDPAKEELRYAVATRHSTRRRMPINTRAVLDFDFNSAPQGAEPSIFHLCFENRGAADAHWSFLFPTDLQLEMEYWSQTGQFDEDELHEMFVMDNHLFHIEPRKGVLAPGQSVVVLLQYSHTSIGVHKLPILFKVARGREILLNFFGTTTDPNTCYLHFSSVAHTFTPLPIGDVTPPIQRHQLHNGGAQTVRFQLDLSALEAIQRENCNWEVFKCLTPSGHILPGSSFDLMWIFSPLEPKMYNVDIPVHIQGGESTLLTYTGIGYDPMVMGSTMELADSVNSSLALTQKILLDDQLLYLSEERIDFGNFPLFSRNRRVVYLENRSPNYAVSFNWKLMNSDLDMVIKIEPEHGYIQPRGKQMCKVTFYSETFPSIYDVDIICEVVNESEMERYNQELIKWHQRQEEKSYLFTITEKTLAKEKAAKGKETQNGQSKDRSSPINKYYALPPIGALQGFSDETVADLQADPIPWPPKAFLVHLSVQGRTFTPEEFNKRFAILSEFQFTKRANCPPESIEPLAYATVRPLELGALESVLKMIMRDIVTDKDFKHLLRQISMEPIPFFGMLSMNRRSSGTDVGIDSSASTRDERVGSISAVLEEIGSPVPYEVRDQQTHRPSAKDSEKSSNSGVIQENELLPIHVLKRSDEVRSMLESVIENTVFNIMTEASLGEISLTARPRFVGLPPSARGRQRSMTPSND